ncbi:MAG: AraC family transcriptional regulator [Pseudomonadales bacterium]|nr:AraC family transcriptional regulator [Pseudomonadales bacterium]
MQNTEYNVAVEPLEAIVEYLEDRGISLAPVWQRYNTSLAELQEQQFVPFELFSACFDLGEQKTQDLNLGLNAGATISTRHWGQLGYLMLSGDDGFESINYMQRFAKLTTNSMESRFEMSGQHLVCYFKMFPEAYSRHTCEFFISAVYSLGKFMSDGHFKFKEIKFSYPNGSPVEDYERILGCHCLFNQEENKITVEQSALAFTSTFRDPRLKKVLEQHAVSVLQHLGSDDDVVRDLKTFVSDALPNGAPSLKQVCEHFQMSERSLQRLLAKHSLSYQELVDNLRSDLAKTYIENDYSFLDIALLLGYSEQSAFHRAFKRWTGLPPAKYKKKLQAN